MPHGMICVRCFVACKVKIKHFIHFVRVTERESEQKTPTYLYVRLNAIVWFQLGKKETFLVDDYVYCLVMAICFG